MVLTQKQVLDAVSKRGAKGCTRADLSQELNVGPKVCDYRLSQLIAKEDVVRVQQGRFLRFYGASDAPEATPARSVGAPPALGKPYGLEGSLDTLVNELVASMAGVIVGRLRAEVTAKLRLAVVEVAAAVSSEVETYKPPVDKIRLRKVFVGGVLNQQHRDLSKEFEGVCDIVGVSCEDSLPVWKGRASGAYAAIAWTNFISHKHIDALKSMGVQPILVTGGMSALKDKIMEVCI